MTDQLLCPHCGADLRAGPADGPYFNRAHRVEHPLVFVGVLYALCPECGGAWHLHPEGSDGYDLADAWVRDANLQRTVI